MHDSNEGLVIRQLHSLIVTHLFESDVLALGRRERQGAGQHGSTDLTRLPDDQLTC